MLITGNSADNLLNGTGADDTIFGRAGRDTVLGGAGRDLLFGEVGNDTLRGGAGNDTLFGGGGQDTADYGDAVERVVVNLVAGTALGDTEIGRDVLSSIEHVVGGLGDDVIRGNAAANRLDGGDGDDVLDGRTGNDTLVGGGDDDTLDGGNGADRLFGGDDEDLMFGGDGNDTLDGGTDDDLMFGGSGVDRIDGGVGDDQIAAGSGSDTVHGGDDDDAISGDEGNDLLFGGADQDTLIGEDGDDRVDGGASHDIVAGGNGNDTVWGGAGRDTVLGDGGDDLLYGDDPLGPTGADIFAYYWFTLNDTDNDFFPTDLDLDLRSRLSDSDIGHGVDIIADFQPGVDRLAIFELSGLEAFAFLDGEVIDLSRVFGSTVVPLGGNNNGVLDEGDAFVSVQSVTVDGVAQDSLVLDVTGLRAVIDASFGAPLDLPSEATDLIVLYGVGSGVLTAANFVTLDDTF